MAQSDGLSRAAIVNKPSERGAVPWFVVVLIFIALVLLAVMMWDEFGASKGYRATDCDGRWVSCKKACDDGDAGLRAGCMIACNDELNTCKELVSRQGDGR